MSISTFGPAPAFDAQESVFSRSFAILEAAIQTQAFPGAAIAVAQQGQLVAQRGFGRFTFDPQSPPVERDSVFDLASVSKAVATTSMAMILYERGLLDLDLPLASMAPEFAGDDPRRLRVTLRQLLAHSSGLPAYEKLFQRARSPEELLSAAFSVPLARDPGQKAEYSDIGFILLGVSLERLADEKLDRFCRREIFGPLGMTRSTFVPPQSWRELAVPTADDRTFRHRVIQGEVQDENASVLGGVAGHAGLFGTAGDLATFAQVLLSGAAVFRPATVSLFTRRQTSPSGTSRALGWDTPSA
ncbi:MAG TPA: serine hydrolase domain-containing protein, partial [Terriglobales bacterium]|nr:serine hydrolase domain-containing protein [Terriglobales bacterium]